MTIEKTFSLNVVLSATTGRLLCPIEQLYEILNHVTGDQVFSHVIPRAIRFAGLRIFEQYPELRGPGEPQHLSKLNTLLDDARAREESPSSAVAMWLDWVQEKGTCDVKSEYTITSHADTWLRIDPLKELATKVPTGTIAVAVQS